MHAMWRAWPADSKIRLHGFRSCFFHWSGDCTDASEETREFALAHVKRGVAGRYRRKRAIEKRRVLMQQWATYSAGGNIIPFKRASAEG